ncbi:hypothetical protein AAHC03_01194 [Spirometra sp. Aus1]
MSSTCNLWERFFSLGTSKCPRYANVELLADKLAFNLPNFKVSKLVLQAEEWTKFASQLAHENRWPLLPSPIIWRELVDRGGMSTLIGGAKDFQEYAKAYYDLESSFTTQQLMGFVEDNKRYKRQDIELALSYKPSRPLPKIVTIIGADSHCAHRLLMLLTLRKEVKAENKISLRLFSEDPTKAACLDEVKSQVEDSACPSIQSVNVEYTLMSAVKDASLIVLLDVVPRLHFHRSSSYQTANSSYAVLEPREAWLSRRFVFLHRLGLHVAQHCPADVKVLVAGSLRLFEKAELVAAPINFDVQALFTACGGKLATRNIVGLVRPLEWRLKAAIAKKLGVRCCDLVDLIVWGNIDHRFHVDISRARIYRRHGKDDAIIGPSWFNLDAEPLIWDAEWLKENFVREAVEKMKVPARYQAAYCHASAIASFIDQWLFGKVEREEMLESLVLISDGCYGVPRGVAFSFPVTMNPSGCFAAIEDIPMDADKQTAINMCIKDVLEDWAVVNPVLLENYLDEINRFGNAIPPAALSDEVTLEVDPEAKA